jgi:hypothetical protein
MQRDEKSDRHGMESLTMGFKFCERIYSVVASWYSRVMVATGWGAGRVSRFTEEVL